MFLDIRVTLATFVTAIGLALVMFAVGTRAWVGVGYERPAAPRFEARALAAPDPIERGFGVSPAGARSVTGVSAPLPNTQSFLPKAEPVRPAERVTGRDDAPTASNVMPGAGAVVQERFDVLHEPSAQTVRVRPITAGVGGPLVPLPRPRSSEPVATAASASIVGQEQADQGSLRPKATLGSTKRAEAPAKKRPPRQTTSYFGSLFGR